MKKVLIINRSDRQGGAAVAAIRLAKALQSLGIPAKVLVLDKHLSDDAICSISAGSRFKRILAKAYFFAERLQIFLQNRFSRKYLFAVSTLAYGFDITHHPWVQEAEILHFHWINQGMLSQKALQNLFALDKKVVWTLHDLWPLTGICHHPRECDRYHQACGSCPFLHSDRSNDLSNQVLQKKNEIYACKAIHFVGCSQWITARAKQSSLAHKHHFEAIPNPIDTAIFSPADKLDARQRLGLPAEKKLILFGAVIASDKRKGIDYLIEAMHLLAHRADEIELVMFGAIKGEELPNLPLQVHQLGYVSDQQTLLDMYRSADLFVTPSLEENLPNVIMEAMACATPCVGFQIGGIPEMIQHLQNGYVAQYKSARDLAKGIEWVLEHQIQLSASARHFVEDQYAQQVVARRYLKLYEQKF